MSTEQFFSSQFTSKKASNTMKYYFPTGKYDIAKDKYFFICEYDEMKFFENIDFWIAWLSINFEMDTVDWDSWYPSETIRTENGF